MALEYDDFGNWTRWASFVDAMRERDIVPGAWVTEGGKLSDIPSSADFLIAEIEGAGDFNGVVADIPLLDYRPRAIVTTYDGLLVKQADGTTDKDATEARCKPLVDAGFYLQYEAYFMSQPDNTDADHCGFPGERVVPVIGVGFNGKSLDQQQALQVPGFGLYLAEYL